MGNDKRISIHVLRQLVDYDANTGRLTWKARTAAHIPNDGYRRSWNTKYAGRAAFQMEQQGYRAGRILGVSMKGHRLAWAIHHGRWPKGEIDHINGDRADNRLSNLREVTRAENRKNLKRQDNNGSGVTGVSDRGARGFQAYIKVNGKQMHLGYFPTLDAAATARSEAEKRHRFHTNHGRCA